MDPLTYLIARLPLELSGDDELDDYVNALIEDARRSLGQGSPTTRVFLG